jgi:hypothetical protein
MELLTKKYEKEISGTLGCFDRIVITGTIPGICYSSGMTSYLYKENIRIFDYPKFVLPFRDELRANAERLASLHDIEIEFVRKSHIRKEDLVQKALKKNGKKSGLVHILSAMESCTSYTPWHNKSTGKTYLKGGQGKCLHYYFYFIDEELGLGYIRVPTWCDFRLQIYFNGHSLLSRDLDKAGIGYSMLDNSFDSVDNFPRVQKLSDNLNVESLHKKFDELASRYCPVHQHFNQRYHWSIMQAEYATDIIFKKQETLQSLYSELVTTAIHTVTPDNIMTFFSKKLDPRYTGEIGNNYNVRIQGSRIKHSVGKNSIKMYDKFGKILRIETTVNDVTFFKHYREVEQRDGTKTKKYTAMRKNIYSLNGLQEILINSNRRYLEFISSIESRDVGRKNLNKISNSKRENDRNYKGFNFFNDADLSLFLSIVRGEFNIYGFQNKTLQQYLPYLKSGQISRLLKRLRVHGIIKKVGRTYKYYLTRLGQKAIVTAQKLKEAVLIPSLNY